MHDEQHRPPVHPAAPQGPDAKPKRPVRRPLPPVTGPPEEPSGGAGAGGDAASFGPAIHRKCASCTGEEERKEPGKGALEVSQPDDPLEKEADRIADHVMRTADPAPRVSREDEDEAVARSAASPLAGAGAGAAPRVDDALRSAGAPLSEATRAFMEPRFGRGFGDVRVHTDAQASRSAEAVAARAYTVGSHVVFRSGEYAPEAPGGARLLAHELAHVAQQASAPAEGLVLHRDGSGSAETSAPAAGAPAGAGAGAAQPGAAAPSGIIVEDSATQVDPKQMKKSAFLSALRSRVDAVVDESYTETIDRLAARATVVARFAIYSAKDAKSLEQTIHAEVPGASAPTAAGALAAIVAKVRTDVAADVGEKKAKAKEDAGKPGIFFKAAAGGAREDGDPRAVQAELGGGGEPLPGALRTGVESAMGTDFSGVRVHAGASGAKVAGSLGARALTVGKDIAFGAGEYHPGTPVGDALIAHELAHVAQQGGGEGAVATKAEAAHDGPLEAAADESAMGAVLSIWGGVKAGAAKISRSTGAALKSGLRLQRCGTSKNAKLTGDLQAAVDESVWRPTFRDKLYEKHTKPEVQKADDARADPKKDLKGIGSVASVDNTAAGIRALRPGWGPPNTVDQKRGDIEKVANGELGGAGVPHVNVVVEGMKSAGFFSAKDWSYHVNEDTLQHSALSSAEAAALTDNVAHESRHAQQAFLAARYSAGQKNAAGQKKSAQDIASELEMLESVAARAVASPLGPADPDFKYAKDMHFQRTDPTVLQKYKDAVTALNAAIGGLDADHDAAKKALDNFQRDSSQPNFAAGEAAIKKVHTQMGTVEAAYLVYRSFPGEQDAHQAGVAAKRAYERGGP